MELRAVTAIDSRRLAAFDLLIAVAAGAVLVSLFLPWFVAEYEPHTAAAQACFDQAGAGESGYCVQSWNGWRTISIHWALPIAAFLAFPTAAQRVLGERHRPVSREWLALTGALLGVVTLGFFFTPDLAGLNQAQIDQARIFSAEPWIYTSVRYSTGIFSALGFALTGFVAAALRTQFDPDGVTTGRSHAALVVVALVLALLPMAYLGELLTRF